MRISVDSHLLWEFEPFGRWKEITELPVETSSCWTSGGLDQDVVVQGPRDVSWGPPLVLFSSGRVRNGVQGEEVLREQRLGKHGLQQLVWLGRFLGLWSSFCSYLEPSEMVPAADFIQTSELLSDEGEMWGRSVESILVQPWKRGGGT